MSEFSVSPVLLWFLIGIFCYVTELVLPGFIVFFFGIGAWCTALAVWLFDLSLSTQLLIFISCSIVALLALRSYVRSVFFGVSKDQDDSVVVGGAPATGVVVQEIIPPAMGKVKYGGSFWNARAEMQVTEGTVVAIVEQSDLIITVKPLDGAGE